jgi:hypothetical protein
MALPMPEWTAPFPGASARSAILDARVPGAIGDEDGRFGFAIVGPRSDPESLVCGHGEGGRRSPLGAPRQPATPALTLRGSPLRSARCGLPPSARLPVRSFAAHPAGADVRQEEKRQMNADDQDGDQSGREGVNALADAEQRDRVAQADRLVGSLPPLYRAVYLLNLREGLSYEAIADQLGIDAGQVQQMMAHALLRLLRTKRMIDRSRASSGRLPLSIRLRLWLGH